MKLSLFVGGVGVFFAGVAAAQVSTPVQAGQVASPNYQVNASLGNSCVITRPNDYDLTPTLFWTTINFLQPIDLEINRFTVACNRAARYTLTWRGVEGFRARSGDPQGPFDGNTPLIIQGNARYVRLWLNGQPTRNLDSSVSNTAVDNIDVRLSLRRLAAGVPVGFSNPQTAGTNLINSAATSGGQAYVFNARFAANNSLTQVDRAGNYSGRVEVTLGVLAP